MPLLQPPAEQPFSLIPPNWNPVSNDRVLLRLGLIISRLSSSNTLLMSVIHLRRPVRLELPRPIEIYQSQPGQSERRILSL
jgi:hypothetical protein